MALIACHAGDPELLVVPLPMAAAVVSTGDTGSRRNFLRSKRCSLCVETSSDDEIRSKWPFLLDYVATFGPSDQNTGAPR